MSARPERSLTARACVLIARQARDQFDTVQGIKDGDKCVRCPLVVLVSASKTLLLNAGGGAGAAGFAADAASAGAASPQRFFFFFFFFFVPLIV